jgi:hypothetical protein
VQSNRGGNTELGRALVFRDVKVPRQRVTNRWIVPHSQLGQVAHARAPVTPAYIPPWNYGSFYSGTSGSVPIVSSDEGPIPGVTIALIGGSALFVLQALLEVEAPSIATHSSPAKC